MYLLISVFQLKELLLFSFSFGVNLSLSFSSVCQIHVIGIKANTKLRLPVLEVGGIINNVSLLLLCFMLFYSYYFPVFKFNAYS